MLYDPKWNETTTKPDVFSLEGLIAWLETQPAGGQYDWEDCNGGCLIGVYGLAMGLGKGWHQLHSHFYDNDLLFVASDAPYTFGDALKRARKAVSA